MKNMIVYSILCIILLFWLALLVDINIWTKLIM